MNVSVENLGSCRRLLRVEVEAAVVDKTFDDITAIFRKKARIPGFRPGKAPARLIQQAYGPQIEEEVRNRLVNESYQKAVKEQNLTSVTDPAIEEVQFGRGEDFQFIVNMEVAPSVDLPEYKKIPVKREVRTVTDDDVTRALDVLRGQRATYEDVDRPVEFEDFVVVNYTGVSEGRPLEEIAPAAKGLATQSNYWMEVKPNAFIPGFMEQVIGAKKDDVIEVSIDFPDDFIVPELAGKPGRYRVEIVQVKVKRLPELDDAFAESFEAESLTALIEGVRRDLTNDLNHKQKNAIRDQLLKSLISRCDFELPRTLLENETRQSVQAIVQGNRERGVSEEKIEDSKNEIFNSASSSARERVKMSFIIDKVADAEGLKPTMEELNAQIKMLADQNKMPVAKMMKKLQEQNGVNDLYQRIKHIKTLDFLELHAEIEDVLPSAAS